MGKDEIKSTVGRINATSAITVERVKAFVQSIKEAPMKEDPEEKVE